MVWHSLSARASSSFFTAHSRARANHSTGCRCPVRSQASLADVTAWTTAADGASREFTDKIKNARGHRVPPSFSVPSELLSQLHKRELLPSRLPSSCSSPQLEKQAAGVVAAAEKKVDGLKKDKGKGGALAQRLMEVIQGMDD